MSSLDMTSYAPLSDQLFTMVTGKVELDMILHAKAHEPGFETILLTYVESTNFL